MARFTLTDDTTEVPAVTMHARGSGSGGHKRLHLAGVAEGDRKALTIEPTLPEVVKGSAPILFESHGGIWTVDLHALKAGKADVLARVKGTAVAQVAVTVMDPLVLPPPDTDQGLLVRLFLAETASPETRQTAKWTAADATRSMQWMRLVLRNRLDNSPRQFMAKGAKTLKDIVTAKDEGKVQYEGFSGYPTLNARIAARITAAFKIANDDSDGRQADYTLLVQAALDVAAARGEVQDPCGADCFLSGWMTVGSSPGDDSVQFQAIMDNQFFMMKRKK